MPVEIHKRRVSAKKDHSSTAYGTEWNIMLAQVLRGIIFFFAVVSLATVSAKEENLTPEEKLDLMENSEEVNEEENPSLDNAVDLQEG